MKIKKIADSFELPKDIVLGIPIVTCYGSDQMTIENHKGILEFNDKYINVIFKINENGKIFDTIIL